MKKFYAALLLLFPRLMELAFYFWFRNEIRARVIGMKGRAVKDFPRGLQRRLEESQYFWYYHGRKVTVAVNTFVPPKLSLLSRIRTWIRAKRQKKPAKESGHNNAALQGNGITGVGSAGVGSAGSAGPSPFPFEGMFVLGVGGVGHKNDSGFPDAVSVAKAVNRLNTVGNLTTDPEKPIDIPDFSVVKSPEQVEEFLAKNKVKKKTAAILRKVAKDREASFGPPLSGEQQAKLDRGWAQFEKRFPVEAARKRDQGKLPHITGGPKWMGKEKGQPQPNFENMTVGEVAELFGMKDAAKNPDLAYKRPAKKKKK